jgi:hypothetical protein
MNAVIPPEEQVVEWITSLSKWGPLRLCRVTGSPVNPIALF